MPYTPTTGSTTRPWATRPSRPTAPGAYNIGIGYEAGSTSPHQQQHRYRQPGHVQPTAAPSASEPPGTQTSTFIAGIYGVSYQRQQRCAGPDRLQRATRHRLVVPALQGRHPGYGGRQQRVDAAAARDLPLQEAVRRRVEADAIRADRRGSGGGLSGSGGAFGRWADRDGEVPVAGLRCC